MEEDELVEQTPKFALLDKEPLPQPLGPGFFARHAREKRRWIKATVKKIGEEVTYKDLKPAIVYVADAAETRFTKVGFSKYPDETRPQRSRKDVALLSRGHTAPLRSAAPSGQSKLYTMS